MWNSDDPRLSAFWNSRKTSWRSSNPGRVSRCLLIFCFFCFIELNRWLLSEHSLDRMNLMSLIVYHKTYCSVCASASARWPVSYGHAVVNQSAARGLLVCPAGNKSWRKIKKNLSQSHNPKSLTLLLLLISILWRACDSFAGWDSSKTIKWLLNKIIVFDAGGKKISFWHQ